jgi:hypothetical protein
MFGVGLFYMQSHHAHQPSEYCRPSEGSIPWEEIRVDPSRFYNTTLYTLTLTKPSNLSSTEVVSLASKLVDISSSESPFEFKGNDTTSQPPTGNAASIDQPSIRMGTLSKPQSSRHSSTSPSQHYSSFQPPQSSARQQSSPPLSSPLSSLHPSVTHRSTSPLAMSSAARREANSSPRPPYCGNRDECSASPQTTPTRGRMTSAVRREANSSSPNPPYSRHRDGRSASPQTTPTRDRRISPQPRPLNDHRKGHSPSPQPTSRRSRTPSPLAQPSRLDSRGRPASPHQLARGFFAPCTPRDAEISSLIPSNLVSKDVQLPPADSLITDTVPVLSVHRVPPPTTSNMLLTNDETSSAPDKGL